MDLHHWCLVRSVLICNVRLKSAKCHLYLAERLPFIELLAHFLFFFTSLLMLLRPGGQFLAYQALNSRRNLADIQASSLIKGLMWMCITLYKAQMEVPEVNFCLCIFLYFSLFFGMKNRKSNDQVGYPQTKFQRTNITNECSSVQGMHNITHVRWSYREKSKITLQTSTQSCTFRLYTNQKPSNQRLKTNKKGHKQPQNQKKLYKN